MILEALFSAVVIVIIKIMFKKFFKRPKVWIIDDSELDLTLYKIRLKLDYCDVRYFSTVHNLALKIALSKPDAVIVDYKLADNINGDQVLKFCDRNHIPAIMITGYDGDIAGVKNEKVIKKSADSDCFLNIEKWVSVVVGKA